MKIQKVTRQRDGTIDIDFQNDKGEDCGLLLTPEQIIRLVESKTSFGQAWIFAIKFCHDYDIRMSDQQLHDFCNLLIEFRDKDAQPQSDGACPKCGGIKSHKIDCEDEIGFA